MQVAKWGNSLAVRLPAVVVEALGLKEGDEIEIHVADGRQFGVARKPCCLALNTSNLLSVFTTGQLLLLSSISAVSRLGSSLTAGGDRESTEHSQGAGIGSK